MCMHRHENYISTGILFSDIWFQRSRCWLRNFVQCLEIVRMISNPMASFYQQIRLS